MFKVIWVPAIWVKSDVQSDMVPARCLKCYGFRPCVQRDLGTSQMFKLICLPSNIPLTVESETVLDHFDLSTFVLAHLDGYWTIFTCLRLYCPVLSCPVQSNARISISTNSHDYQGSNLLIPLNSFPLQFSRRNPIL